MRIDLFLSSVNLVKRRSIATDMLKNGVVSLNNLVVKPSKEVKVGDRLAITTFDVTKNYEILLIPNSKNTPKSDLELYVKSV